MQVQGKESIQVSDAIIQDVVEDLYRQRIPAEEVSHQRVRESLKRLKHRKAYEHVVQITSKITGVPPPRMTPDMEETCRTMFMAVQPSFDRHCPSDRKNFLSYSYCLYKFFELLGYDELLQSFSLLKGKVPLKVCIFGGWGVVKSSALRGALEKKPPCLSALPFRRTSWRSRTKYSQRSVRTWIGLSLSPFDGAFGPTPRLGEDVPDRKLAGGETITREKRGVGHVTRAHDVENKAPVLDLELVDHLREDKVLAPRQAHDLIVQRV